MVKDCQIFISYRRDDCSASAGRLYDRLCGHFASTNIFMDVDNLDPGVDFVDAIEESVASCDALIAVIGRFWLISSDEEGRRRLDNPEDFVRIEIATALNRDVRVIPLLVDGALMPRSRDLPDDLKPLTRRMALEVSHTRFKEDCNRLITTLDRAMEGVKTRPSCALSEIGRISATGRIARQQPAEATPTLVSTEVAISAPPGATPRNEMNAEPFENSLGMKFLPVPIWKGNGSREVARTILMSQWETRVRDYEAFCMATARSHEKPRFAQTADDPVVNVRWEDTKAFCKWLSEKEGVMYRLPTDHEWSCAVGIGDQDAPNKAPERKQEKISATYPWGSQWPPPDDAGNYRGEECATLKESGYEIKNVAVITGFNDGKVFTAPVGSYRANDFGLYDLGGNVWEWCEDHIAKSASRYLRGGSWYNTDRDLLLSSCRYDGDPDLCYDSVGFRCVVEFGPKIP
jgi:formylglycine-generating enzyme required for sulfatase activity